MSTKTLKVKGTFDGQGLEKGLKDVNKELKDISSSAEGTKRSMNDVLKDRNATTNYKRQLQQLTKALTDLTIQYRQLSDAEKQSAIGKGMADKIKEMTQQASLYKDAMMDVQESIRAGASDTYLWDAAKQGMGVLTSAASSFVGIMGLSAESSEKLLKTLTAMRVIESVFTTFKKMQTVLQGQSSLMKVINSLTGTSIALRTSEAQITNRLTEAEIKSKIAKAEHWKEVYKQIAAGKVRSANISQEEAALRVHTKQEELDALAIQKDTVATVTATKATIAYKAALTGLGIAAAVIAISALIKALDDYSSKLKEINALKSATVKSFTDLRTKALELRSAYDELTNDDDRVKWFEKNKTAAEAYVGPLKDVADFENKFKDGTSEFIDGLYKRAVAFATAEKYQEAYGKSLDKISKKWLTAGSTYLTEDLKKLYPEIDFGPGSWFEPDENKVAEVNAKITKHWLEQDKTLINLANAYKDAAVEVANFNAAVNSTDNNNNPPEDPKIKAAVESIEWYNNAINEQKDIMNNATIGSKAYIDAMTKIASLQKELDFKKFLIDLEVRPQELDVLKVDLKVEAKDIDTSSLAKDIDKAVQDELDATDWHWQADIDVQMLKDRKQAYDDAIQNANDLQKIWTNIGGVIDSAGDAIGGVAGEMISVVGSVVEQAGSLMKVILEYAALAQMKGLASAMELPPPANIIYATTIAASLAAMIATIISGIGKFASGGIVSSASKIGDMSIARVNDGEMILNSHQQKNLFSLLNNDVAASAVNSFQPGEVEFIITGDNLRGVLKNMNNKQLRV